MTDLTNLYRILAGDIKNLSNFVHGAITAPGITAIIVHSWLDGDHTYFPLVGEGLLEYSEEVGVSLVYHNLTVGRIVGLIVKPLAESVAIGDDGETSFSVCYPDDDTVKCRTHTIILKPDGKGSIDTEEVTLKNPSAAAEEVPTIVEGELADEVAGETNG